LIWKERNSGRYEHARACRERARASARASARARNNPLAFTTIIFVRVLLLRVLLRFSA
jgi:hypothetical protein